MKYFLIIVYFTFPHWGSPVGNGERLPHAESGEMANAYCTGTSFIYNSNELLTFFEAVFSKIELINNINKINSQAYFRDCIQLDCNFSIDLSLVQGNLFTAGKTITVDLENRCGMTSTQGINYASLSFFKMSFVYFILTFDYFNFPYDYKNFHFKH